MIDLRSADLHVSIDTARGGEIVFLGRPDGPNALFHEAWETPVPASRSMSYGDGTLDWLSHYRGGWQVMFPNAGDECTVDGVPHPVHGEVSSAPALVVDVTPTHAALRSPTRLPVVLERSISIAPGRPAVLVEERIVNQSERSVRYAWGHHPAFRATPAMRIDLPVGPVHFDGLAVGPEPDRATGTWPTVERRKGVLEVLDRLPDPPTERVFMLPERPAGWAALRDPETRTGVGVGWDVGAFPHLWLWQELGGPGFPWFGRASIVALEPVSIWPGDGLARAVERGQARTLEARAGASAWITVALFEATDRPVVDVRRDGRVALADGDGTDGPR
jgi:galactose mutarotase-like enzyme